MNRVIDKIIEESTDIFSIPEIYSLLRRKLQDPYASNAEIADIIKRDPGLSLTILKIVNSALYGFKSSISSVAQAVSIIGRLELSELVLSTVVVQNFNQLPIEKTRLHHHWKHCFLCALIAKKLAKQCSLHEISESIFIAGLLHDTGKLMIYHKFPELVERALNSDIFQSLQIETDILGFNHAELGSELMKAWDLPLLLQSTTLWHHSPESAIEYIDACKVINISNVLAHFEAIDEEIESSLNKETCWKTLNLDIDILFEIHSHAIEELNETIGAFLK